MIRPASRRTQANPTPAEQQGAIKRGAPPRTDELAAKAGVSIRKHGSPELRVAALKLTVALNVEMRRLFSVNGSNGQSPKRRK